MGNKIIYLHGFNSSPQSFKAQQITQYMRSTGQSDRLLVPALSPYPDIAINQIEQLIKIHTATENLCFVGSSLGGYYSTWFAEKYQCPAVLINPSVRPYETLAEYLGDNENYYTEQSWCFNQSHIQQLLAIDVDTIKYSESYLVLLQTGDEVLDYKQAKQKYENCNLVIEEGGDHSFIDFQNHIEHIISFCDTHAEINKH